MNNRDKYPYNEYHKEVDGILYKKCALHDRYFNEEVWFPCNTDYFYKNSKNTKDGVNPECKECTKKKSANWLKENPERRKEAAWKCRRTNYQLQYNRFKNQNQRDNGYRKKWEQSDSGKACLSRTRDNRKVKVHKITDDEWIACKEYFNYKCAYCGLKIEEHYKRYKGEMKLIDFHKEHVDDKGNGTLQNCVPSCHLCNSYKHNYTLDEWYNLNNPDYTPERYNKIVQWVNQDYKQFLIK